MKERSLRVIVACTTFCLFFLISNLTHRVELVKGTAGLAYAAVLSMPTNLSGTPGQTGVVAPINVDNATGIAGVDVTLDFDPLILTATDVQLTTLTSGFSLVSNLTTPGRVVISMARSTGITSGSGALANVIFTVSSSITQGSTALTFQSASLFDENASPISVSTQNGLFTVSSAPAIFMAVKGMQNGIHIRSKTEPGSWGSWIQLAGSTSQAPGLAVFNNRLYLAVKGATNNNIYVYSMDSSGTWSSYTQVSGETGLAPALAAFNNRLYLVVKGVSNNNLYLFSMDASGTWTSWTTIPAGQTSEAPALTSFNGKLYLFVKGATNTNIYYNSMDTGGSWGSWSTLPGGGTGKSPSLAVFANELYVMVKGATNYNLYYTMMDTAGAWDVWFNLPGQTSEAPSMAVLEDRLYVAVKGATNYNIYTRSWDGATWDAAWTMVSGSTDKTPALCTY